MILTLNISSRLGKTPCDAHIFLKPYNLPCNIGNAALDAFIMSIVATNLSIVILFLFILLMKIFWILFECSSNCFNCLESKPDIKFFPCGHIASCKVCFDKQEKKECGICKEVVINCVEQ